MDTIMNTAAKAFGLSLAFHALMALFALLLLNAMHPPIQPFALPMKPIAVVSFSPSAAASVTLSSRPAKEVPSPIKPAPLPLLAIPKAMTATTQPYATPILPDTPPVVPLAPKPSVAPIEAPAQLSAKPVKKIDLSAEKQSFFVSLRTKIQQNLRYPPSARRRGVEGEVNVRFVLENTGAIREITVSQGDTVFHDAAKLAVASASGVKIPETLSDTFPTDIQLTLEFRLD
jgi:periplasmic protein TonB